MIIQTGVGSKLPCLSCSWIFFSHSCFTHCLYKQPPIEQMPADKIFICFQWLESHNTNFILVQFSAKNNITFTLFTCFRIMKYLNSSKLLIIWFKLEKSFSFHLRNCHTTYKMAPILQVCVIKLAENLIYCQFWILLCLFEGQIHWGFDWTCLEYLDQCLIRVVY